jgi:hypothetical protein
MRPSGNVDSYRLSDASAMGSPDDRVTTVPVIVAVPDWIWVDR